MGYSSFIFDISDAIIELKRVGHVMDQGILEINGEYWKYKIQRVKKPLNKSIEKTGEK